MSWYRSGTLALTNGSPTVTGSGTLWLANVQPGHAINLPDGKVYEVLSINSDTSITLGSNYGGSTATGQAYSVQPNQGFSQQAAQLVRDFLTTYASYAATALAGKFGDGTVALPSVTFLSDQDTGVMRWAANSLGIIAGGTLSARFEVGQVVANGNLLLTGATTGSQLIRVGAARSGSGYSILDLQGDTTYSGGLRLIRGDTGANTYSHIEHSGTGDLLMVALQAASVVLGTNSVGRFLVSSAGHLLPTSDNAYDLGGAGTARLRNLYVMNAPTIGSDARLKTNIADEPLGIEMVRALQARTFQYHVGDIDVSTEETGTFRDIEIPAVTEVGADGELIVIEAARVEHEPILRTVETTRAGARTHHGFIAQEVKAALDAVAPDVDFAGWVLADKDDPDSMQHLRLEQFIPICWRAMQQLDAMVTSQAEAIATLAATVAAQAEQIAALQAA